MHRGGTGEGEDIHPAFLQGGLGLRGNLVGEPGFIDRRHIHCGAQANQALRQHLPGDLGPGQEHFAAGSDLGAEGFQQHFGLEGVRHHVGLKAVSPQGLRRGRADGGDFQAAQGAHVAALRQTGGP